MFSLKKGHSPIIHHGTFLSPPDLIKLIIPPDILPKLLGDYTNLILEIFHWKCYLDSTGQPKFDLSACNEAMQMICKIETPISSNILHKISKIDKVNYSKSAFIEYLDFKSEQQMAKNELRRRGNPIYDPSAYRDEKAWKFSKS